MRITGVRFAAAGLLMVSGLLASCSAAHVRPAAHSQAGTRLAGPRASAHAQATAGARLQISRGPWWSQDGVTPCATPALVRAAGHVMGAGTCTGLLAVPPLKVTLAVGQRIDVHMTGAGPSGNRKTSGYLLPRSTRPSVLVPGAVGPDGATQTYRAASPGHAVLVSGTPGCLLVGHHPEQFREVLRSCPVVTVTVVP